MKVILLSDVKKLGRKGEVVEVANGYAQSVLLPKKLALPGTPENLKKAEKQIALKEDKKALDHALLAKTYKELRGKVIHISAKSNEAGKLFEAIHEKQIIDSLEKECGIQLPQTSLKLDEPIKKVGEYQLVLKEGGEQAQITLNVE